MNGEDDKYYFPETLNQQARFFGLPLDELLVIAPLTLLGIVCNMSTALGIVSGVLWLLVRYLKKGQGSFWLLNFCYWYLPTFIFRVTFRSIPDSGFRHWRA
ncbi:type IV conjugative transfer system protein TraL [Kosakonia cowanii]|jgi:conjugal transfer pilus assembly protein TraL|uniref:type IV conjugative transfer system protein TraL n=1 Tax=Kosakonia TaxID=1330547 RepID=UPI00034BF3DE|nr:MULTISPECIES: type IV conjugative transfer system protein TraL [Kosakonia]MBK0079727.1 type IV conjugative transfer system protein TraL [Kosakonia sp. S57]MBK0086763.1 type IV conjugative transfer system protein TraL [Kosakonia sp. S58]MDT3409668.1 conjugal transfer pilus assembly protein TraL [Atlantibacter sp. SORGH_AS_0304]HCW0180202.1 type IV conjugative transfer system protein TraL [Citrobacter freundii]